MNEAKHYAEQLQKKYGLPIVGIVFSPPSKFKTPLAVAKKVLPPGIFSTWVENESRQIAAWRKEFGIKSTYKQMPPRRRMR